MQRALISMLALVPLTTPAAAQLQQAEWFKGSAPDAFDQFGHAVALDGDLLAVAVVEEDSAATGIGGDATDDSAFGAGAVEVFVRVGGTWQHDAYLKASNTDAADRFGDALALDGTTLVVGAPWEDSAATGIGGDQADDTASQAGAVYVFERSSATGSAGIWTQTAYLKPSVVGGNDTFGRAVALDGDTLVVGTPQEDSAATTIGGDPTDDTKTNAGAVHVFERPGPGGAWQQTAYLKAPNSGWQDFFGDSLALSGDWLVVGAPKEDGALGGVDPAFSSGAENSGAAYVFRRSAGTWSFHSLLKAEQPAPFQVFGTAVAVDGDRIAVGAPSDNSPAAGVDGTPMGGPLFNAGSVHAYRFVGQSWRLEAYIKPAAPSDGDFFGAAVALEGAAILVGSTGEDSGTLVVDGPEGDAQGTNSGAGYLFEHDGTQWSQVHFLKAAHPGFHALGSSVALDAGRALVGANLEDSSGSGVSPNPLAGTLQSSGAAFLFEAPTTSCGTTAYGDPGPVNIATLGGTAQPQAGTQMLFTASGFNGAQGPVWIVVTTAQAAAPFVGGTAWIDLTTVLPAPFGVLPTTHTAGNVLVALPIPSAAAGQTFYAQAAALDGSQPSALALSNGLAITVCP